MKLHRRLARNEDCHSTVAGDKPDSKVHGANMVPTWVLSAPDGPHVSSMNLAIREIHGMGNTHKSSKSTDIMSEKLPQMTEFLFVRIALGRWTAPVAALFS